jgi:hypothetical protein
LSVAVHYRGRDWVMFGVTLVVFSGLALSCAHCDGGQWYPADQGKYGGNDQAYYEQLRDGQRELAAQQAETRRCRYDCETATRNCHRYCQSLGDAFSARMCLRECELDRGRCQDHCG